MTPTRPTEADQEAERLRQEQDRYLDEALKETFPASDPIAPGHPQPKKPDRRAAAALRAPLPR